MNSKDYRNLQEAYLDVYEQEEILDEISIGMKRRAADASVDKVNKAGERFRSSTSVDVQPYLMKKKDKAEAQHLRLAKAAESYDLYDIILSHLIDEGYDLSDYTQLDEVSDKLATAARNLRQKRYTKSADQARNLQLSKGNRADMFYKNFDKTVKLNDTLKSREKRTGTKIPRVEQLDLYDIILSHLIDEGYVDTQEAALAIMANMSEEWKETIVETRMDPRGRPASGPMNVYANPKGKPSQAHLDAVKSYDAEQKKKTPEQRKAEQDAYRERQMNNK
jgi:hypothetical protein